MIVPPFLEIVLLFAAARSNPRGTLATEQLGWIGAQLESCAGGATSKQAARDSLDEIGTLLRRLETVPVSFWSSDEALELLAVHVVERSGQARDAHAARMLARALEHGLPPWSFTSNAGRPLLLLRQSRLQLGRAFPAHVAGRPAALGFATEGRSRGRHP